MRNVAALLVAVTFAAQSFACYESLTTLTPLEPSLEDDMARLTLLEDAIRKLIGEPLCSDDSQCHAAPLGVKPCGGPWKYLIYSIQTVDVAALQRAIDHYDALNAQINRRHHLLSDCAIVPQPRVTCSAGTCAAGD